MAPIALPGGLVFADVDQAFFGQACGIVVASTVVALVISRGLDLHVGKALVKVDPAQITFEQRLEAADKVLLTPLFAVIGGLALTASWELRGDVESRWHGVSATSRWCMHLYCAKMLLDVPVQAYTLRAEPAKRLQMVGHHALSFVAIGLGCVTHRCCFFACWAVCSELSTPFLNAVMAIKLFTGTRTPAQKRCHTLAGAGLWAAYLPFRLALFPAWFRVWFGDQAAAPDRTAARVTAFERAFYPLVILFLLALSCVWFVAITRGLHKALTKRD